MAVGVGPAGAVTGLLASDDVVHVAGDADPDGFGSGWYRAASAWVCPSATTETYDAPCRSRMPWS